MRTKIIITSIICITLLEIIALMQGIDGILLTSVIAIIAGIAGLSTPTPKFLEGKK